MASIIYCVFLLFLLNTINGYFLVDSSVFPSENTTARNSRPKIGILAQEISYHLNRRFPDTYESYIAASYVKYVEGAGALPIPIW